MSIFQEWGNLVSKKIIQSPTPIYLYIFTSESEHFQIVDKFYGGTNVSGI